MDNTSLGNRMKSYENVFRNKLTNKIPLIIILDGKAFHTFTKGMDKPFDKVLIKTMQDTTKRLCESIQGCVIGYTQSDEITLVLLNDKTPNTSAWFDNNIQKIVSVSSSMATLYFNENFIKNDLKKEYKNKYCKAIFDSRVFLLPKHEVINCLIWRQQDCIKNSISSVAQANFSHKELMNKNTNMMQEMLFTLKGINWYEIDNNLKNGSFCTRKEFILNNGTSDYKRNKWVIDKETPIFSQNKEYIEKILNNGE